MTSVIIYKYNFHIKYILYKNPQDRTILIFFNVVIFLKIGCTNLDVAANFIASALLVCFLLDPL